jgi:hypothetical protein
MQSTENEYLRRSDRPLRGARLCNFAAGSTEAMLDPPPWLDLTRFARENRFAAAC